MKSIASNQEEILISGCFDIASIAHSNTSYTLPLSSLHSPAP